MSICIKFTDSGLKITWLDSSIHFTLIHIDQSPLGMVSLMVQLLFVPLRLKNGPVCTFVPLSLPLLIHPSYFWMFHCIFGQTTDGLMWNMVVGWTHQGASQADRVLGMLKSFLILASDWLSSFCSFADKLYMMGEQISQECLAWDHTSLKSHHFFRIQLESYFCRFADKCWSGSPQIW